MYSKELSEMLEVRKGFRNSEYGGSGEIMAQEIIKYEMFELENEDIYDFFVAHYGLRGGFDFSSSEEEFDLVIGEMMGILKDKLGLGDISPVYGLWLTSKEGVYSNYSSSILDESVYEYHLPEVVVPISDLANQGSLFVSSKPSYLWKSDWVQPPIIQMEQLSEIEIRDIEGNYPALNYPNTYKFTLNDTTLGYADFTIKENTLFIHNIYASIKRMRYGQFIICMLFKRYKDVEVIKGYSISGPNYFWESIGAVFKESPKDDRAELFELERLDFSLF